MSFAATSPAYSLDEEHKALVRLLHLIKQEQTELLDANIDGLSALIQEKSGIVMQMSKLANSRHRALALAGFKGEDSGMQAWLDSTANAAANNIWLKLLTLTKSAKELNHINGLLINKYLARNQNALNALQGHPQGSNFYGPNGQSTKKTATRSLIVG